jgi:hypothetical protein
VIVAHAVKNGILVLKAIVSTAMRERQGVYHPLRSGDDGRAEKLRSLLLNTRDEIEDNIVGHAGINVGRLDTIAVVEELDKLFVRLVGRNPIAIECGIIEVLQLGKIDIAIEG